ncbi:hypothetical protein A9P82_01215 [Arachidicoccus ginsenosidimutans]|uniref:hypothetical protein n=1 Tax=Arachidicoccus sp. BS20 TaxID=1850526 RepID=UPI0007F0807F|nr:hypothetical protein [Arachidicoccus sp. BS20]ANI88060.1 hypothetical protein A9P82_01215 [Arachidicoccus sp. BS20]
MKKYIMLFCLSCLLLAACDKQNFSSSPDAYLYVQLPFGGDTLSFDTVFTSVGSVTQRFKIFNPNKEGIHIDEIKLSGGSNSYFKINVNGNAGTDFQNIDLAGGDSLYVFVAVNINPNDVSNPFVVSDSIGYSYNGHQQFVQLQAYGQNAVFMNAQTINHDTVWKNKLPIVLLGNTTVVSNTTLTIEKGTKIYCHANTIFEVDGKLIANGERDTASRIVFTNDRLDYNYNEMTNQWRGINFGASSKGNVLNNVTVKNAFVGIADTMKASPESISRLILNGCILTNHDYAALYLRNSNVSATNCLITNSNVQVVLENGGSYSFNYCTLAGYGNDYVIHNNPSLVIENNAETAAASVLQATFINCIIYGDDNQADEIKTDEQGGANFSLKFGYGLYKAGSTLSGITFSNSIQNADPQFLNIDNQKNEYDFRLQSTSPAIGTAAPNAVKTDILGQQRDVQKTTVGCYEFKN